MKKEGSENTKTSAQILKIAATSVMIIAFCAGSLHLAATQSYFTDKETDSALFTWEVAGNKLSGATDESLAGDTGGGDTGGGDTGGGDTGGGVTGGGDTGGGDTGGGDTGGGSEGE